MGWSYKGLRRLVSVTMSHLPLTIAPPPIPLNPSFTPSLILRQQPPSRRRSAATMTTTTTTNDGHLEAIFTQKRLVRSKVKKDLRSMDPTLRSHQGMFFTFLFVLVIEIIIILYATFIVLVFFILFSFR